MELLVRIIDKPHPADHPRNKAAMLGKRGYVIAVQSDGFAWSQRERTSPEWIIIRASITTNEAAGLLTPEVGDPVTNLLRWRGFRLDLDALGLTTARTAEIVSTTRTAVMNSRTQLAPLTR